MSIAKRIKQHMIEEYNLHGMIGDNGPGLIERLCKSRSLRQLARDTGLSPTYLSQCKTGKQILSMRAYVLLEGMK